MKIGQIPEREDGLLTMTMKEEFGFWRAAELLHRRENVSAEGEGESSRRKSN